MVSIQIKAKNQICLGPILQRNMGKDYYCCVAAAFFLTHKSFLLIHTLKRVPFFKHSRIDFYRTGPSMVLFGFVFVTQTPTTSLRASEDTGKHKPFHLGWLLNKMLQRH
jgi:hypothetical protein